MEADRMLREIMRSMHEAASHGARVTAVFVSAATARRMVGPGFPGSFDQGRALTTISGVPLVIDDQAAP